VPPGPEEEADLPEEVVAELEGQPEAEEAEGAEEAELPVEAA
jgi:hypothetical protein